MKWFHIFIKIIVFTIIVGIVSYMTYLENWPWWIGGSIILIILSIYILYVIVRKNIIIKKEQSFIKDVAKKISKKPSIAEIENEWKEYFNILRKSGKNVYDLPWMMVIGESGNGKTSLIKYSNLSLPLTAVSRASEIFSTKHCDWWFFEEAVILDVAGKYCVAEDIDVDEKEWNELLSLLSQTRQQEPLNAIVCVVSVDKLFDNDKLKIEAENLKARINDIMKTLGVRIPVFIMVTKMDMVGGYVDFFNHYKEHFNEVMGYVDEDNLKCSEIINLAEQNLNDRIASLLENIDDVSFRETAFLEEFKIIFYKLKQFNELLFANSSYMEDIYFKGIYFSSAIQTECEYSFFKNLNLETKENFNTKIPMFIKDFFKEVLPSQRSSYFIIKKYISKRFKSKQITFFSIILLLIGLFGIISFSFYKEYNLIQSIDFNISDVKGKNLNSKIIALNNLKTSIEEYEYYKNQMTFQLYPFSDKADKILKQKYVTIFEHKLLNNIKIHLSNNLNKIDKVHNYGVINDYVGFLVNSILVLKLKLNLKKLTFSQYFNSFIRKFLVVEENLPNDMAEMAANEYINYLKWNNNYIKLNKDLDFFQNKLDFIIKHKPKLKWLTDKSVSLLDDLTLSDFWNIDIPKSVVIKGAFTDGEMKNIKISINQLKESVKNKKEFLKDLKYFNKWYQEEFFREWYNFSLHFDITDYIIKNQSLLALISINMRSEQNPYFEFLKRASEEIQYQKQQFLWTKLLTKYTQIVDIANSINNSNSLIKKLETKKEQLLENIKKKVNKNTTNSDIKRAIFYNEYIKNIKEFPDISDNKISYNLVKDLFSTQGGNSKLSTLYLSYIRFKKIMPQFSNADNIWNLIEGPVHFLFRASFYNTGKEINKLWNEKVLSNLSKFSVDELYGRDGYVRKFINNEIGIFLLKTPNGFKSRNQFNNKIDFKNSFLQFLDTLDRKYKSRKSVYNIKITTMPISMNKEALIKGYKTKLVLSFPNRQEILINYNYKKSETFKYAQDCTGVDIYIYFENLTLKKHFNNFISFLKAFKGDELILTNKDFNINLDDYKIKWIKLQYKIYDDGLLDYTKRLIIPEKICKE